MADTTPTREIRNMVNGDGNHYTVTDKLTRFNTRYFRIRGNARMCKTLRSFVKNATNYEVMRYEINADRFKIDIVKED